MHAHPSQFRDANAFVIHAELIICYRKTIVSALAVKRWITGATGEEVFESASEMDDRHLWVMPLS
jgi:hypothetical protein